MEHRREMFALMHLDLLRSLHLTFDGVHHQQPPETCLEMFHKVKSSFNWSAGRKSNSLKANCVD